MSLTDLFKPIPTMHPTEVRTFINTKDPKEFNIIDVRQPKEYEQRHLPGAALIPLGELNARLDEIDPKKPTITY
jgi:rhodanese-related sulfurtransferase